MCEAFYYLIQYLEADFVKSASYSEFRNNPENFHPCISQPRKHDKTHSSNCKPSQLKTGHSLVSKILNRYNAHPRYKMYTDFKTF